MLALTSLSLAANDIVIVYTNNNQYIGTYMGATTVTAGTITINAIQLDMPGLLYLDTMLAYNQPGPMDQVQGFLPTVFIYKLPGLDSSNALYIPTSTIFGIAIPNTNIQNVYNNYVANFTTYSYKSQPSNSF